MGDVVVAIAEPRRRQLLTLLRTGERSVSDLAAEFDVTRPAISQHLRVLREAHLVAERRDGRRRLYSLDPSGFARLHAELSEFWDMELADLVSAAENRTRGRETT